MFEFPSEDEFQPEDLMTRRSNAVCLSEAELEQYLHNRLSGTTRESIEEHLLCCQSCLDRVTEEETFAASFQVAARRIEVERLRAAYSGDASGWVARLWNRIRHPSGTALSLAFAASFAVLVLVALPEFRRGPTLDVSLVAARGLSSTLSQPVEPGRRLRLNLDTTGLPETTVRLELAGAANHITARSTATPAGGQLTWDLGRGLDTGTYWVRVYQIKPDSLLREFALVVK